MSATVRKPISKEAKTREKSGRTVEDIGAVAMGGTTETDVWQSGRTTMNPKRALWVKKRKKSAD